MAANLKEVTLELGQLMHRCATQPRGILGDGIQYWLNIRRRAGNDAKNLARCGLLLQSLGDSRS